MKIPTFLIDGYRDFKRNHYQRNKDLYEKLADQGQTPMAMWIGCSDSRVLAEEIVGARPGDLFIIRNVANIVPSFHNQAVSAGAGIEFGVKHLKIPHIIVCGHSDCGGVKAIAGGIDPKEDALISKWVEYSDNDRELARNTNPNDHESLNELVKANVLSQVRNLQTYPCVKEAIAADTLSVHAWFYDLKVGLAYIYDTEKSIWNEIETLD